MREFTEEEKSLLRRINSEQGNNLYSLIDPWIEGIHFDINTVTNNVTISFDTEFLTNKGFTVNERLLQIQTILIQSVNLIKLFEDKGYLFSFKNINQIPNPLIFGQAIVNLPSEPYQFPDPRISELVVKYSIQELFITPELNKFITDGFITREEVRANRQFNVTRRALKITRIALIVSTTGVLLTLVFNIYGSFFKNSANSNQYYPQNDRYYDSLLKFPNFDSVKNKEIKRKDTIKSDTSK